MSKTAELTDQEYVEVIVKPLIDHPDEVVTSRTVDEMGVLIQLTVNREDMGKVIGREGRTAKAIRLLLRVFGSRHDSRINLKIVEPGGGEATNNELASPDKLPEKLDKPDKPEGLKEEPPEIKPEKLQEPPEKPVDEPNSAGTSVI